MTEHQKQLEIAAIDEAYKDVVMLLFNTYADPSTDTDEHFEKGLAAARTAYDTANRIIGRTEKNAK